MHILNLPSRVELGPKDAVEPGEYVVEDVSGAQLLVLAGGGKMRLATQEPPLNPETNYNGKKILILRAGGFGDLVLMTPVLREIKRRWPQCVLTVSTMGHYGQVLANLPFVDAVLPYPLPLDVYAAQDAHVFYENAIERNPRAQEVHMTELFGEIAGITGIENLRPEYRVKATEAIWAAEAYPRVNGTRRVCIQIGASAKCRVYPRDLMGQAVAALLKRGWEVFLMGAAGEIKLPDTVPPGLRNLAAADLTFRQSCAVASMADCVVGNDSAMLHVAGALGVPAVGLYGPFPWQLRTKHCPTTVSLQGAGKCAPCFHHTNVARRDHFPADCPSKARGFCEVLAEIKPERIVAKVEQIARTPGHQEATGIASR